MADDTRLNAGAGGDLIASDDIAGTKFQRVKLTLGADGVNDLDVASGNPMPITAPPSLPLPAGASTAALQLPAGHDVTVDNAGAGAAVNIQDGGNVITVDGTVTSDVGTGTRPISAASLPLPAGAATAADQTSVIGTDGAAGPASTVSIAGTQATGEIQELRVDANGEAQVDVLSSALPTGAATATGQLPDGHNVTVDNATLTVDAPLATPVHTRLSDGTDAIEVTAAGELNVLATAQPGVDIGDVSVRDVTPVTATGTITALNGTVQIDVGGYGSVAIQITGTWTATVTFQGTVDGTNWETLQVVPLASGTAVTSTTINGAWLVAAGGMNLIRCEATLFTSGTIQVDLQTNVAASKQATQAGGTGGTSETDDSVFTG